MLEVVQSVSHIVKTDTTLQNGHLDVQNLSMLVTQLTYVSRAQQMSFPSIYSSAFPFIRKGPLCFGGGASICIMARKSCTRSAAAMLVTSALSYAGATSTRSAPLQAQSVHVVNISKGCHIHEVETSQSTQDTLHLAYGPATSLGGSRSWGEGRVDHVDIEAKNSKIRRKKASRVQHT